MIVIWLHVFWCIYVKLNWKQRSHGFIWDWAELQYEDVETKTYPFPFPRVRKDNDTTVTSPKEAKACGDTEKEYNDTVLAPPDINNDSNASENITLLVSKSPNEMVSSTVRPNVKVKYVTTSTCTHVHNDSEDQNTHDESKLRVHRHYTADKNLLAELSNASRREVTRARSTLLLRRSRSTAHV